MSAESRELLVMRHAKSDWGAGIASDFDRPLAPRGRRVAPQVGAWLAAEGRVPDLIVSSPALRARQTAELVSESLGLDAGAIVFDERIYAADRRSLLRVLRDVPGEAGRVLLVGHNPGFEDLAEFLAGDTVVVPEDGKFFPTATLARLTLPADWSDLDRGAGVMHELVRPRDLPDGGDFSVNTGGGRRRPR